jgi:hypothetical protein
MHKTNLNQDTLLALKRKRERDKLMEALESTQAVPELDDEVINAESTSQNEDDLTVNDPPPVQLATTQKTQPEKTRKAFMTSKLLTRLLTIGVIISLLILAALGVAFGYYYLNHHGQAPSNVKVEAPKHKATKPKEKSSQSTAKSQTSTDKSTTQSSATTQSSTQQQSQQVNAQQSQSTVARVALPSVGAQGVASNSSAQQAAQSQTQPKVVTQQPAQQSTQSNQQAQQSTNEQSANTQKEQSTSSSNHKSSIKSNPVYDAWDDEDELTIYDSKGNPVNVTH